METSRAQTLEALKTFIQLQKTMLVQQQADIERLRLLKMKVRKDPEEFMKNLGQELDDRAFRLSEQGDCRLALPPTWDWAAFENADTTPLRTFAHKIHDKILQRTQPCTYQQSPLSDLQKIVKEARVNIVDPVLAQFQHLHTEEDEEESDPDPEEMRKEEERGKIRELKKRKIRAGGLKLPSSSSAGWGSATGVFIRHDVDDETVEVDMDIASDGQSSPVIGRTAGAGPPPPPLPLGKAKLKSNQSQRESRARQPPRSAQPQPPQAQSEARPLKRVKIVPPAPPRSLSSTTTTTITTPTHSTTAEEPQKTNAKEPRTAGKPKPETYKQAWSVSEQNLLEQLLEQVPEGEKFRWQKISRAMGGRRTPRQVASRVQKYFQKLKKFGVGIDLS